MKATFQNLAIGQEKDYFIFDSFVSIGNIFDGQYNHVCLLFCFKCKEKGK